MSRVIQLGNHFIVAEKVTHVDSEIPTFITSYNRIAIHFQGDDCLKLDYSTKEKAEEALKELLNAIQYADL